LTKRQRPAKDQGREEKSFARSLRQVLHDFFTSFGKNRAVPGKTNPPVNDSQACKTGVSNKKYGWGGPAFLGFASNGLAA
jgi:hypothetical protein